MVSTAAFHARVRGSFPGLGGLCGIPPVSDSLMTLSASSLALDYIHTVMKLNESVFRPPLCTYRLNWARRTS